VQIHAFQQELTSSPYSHDLIELALAVATSLPVSRQDETALVWLLVAGAPSSDKTQTILLLRELPHAYYLDTLTENSFVSGYLDPKTGIPAQDLLRERDGHCLLIKDLTTLFSLREDKVKKILGDLQSIYDGEYTKYMGTRGRVGYASQFSLMACITPLALAQHHRYMSLIGGRFLVYRVLPLTEEERAEGFALSWGGQGRKAQVQLLRTLVAEHTRELLAQPVMVQGETAVQQAVMNRLAILLARGQAVVQTRREQRVDEASGRLVWVSEVEQVQIEEPWRAVQQLRNLGRALARVHGRASVTAHELELLRRLVLSSIPVDRAEVLALFRTQPGELTRTACAEGIGKSYGRATQLLDELVAVKLLTVATRKPEHIYLPAADVADLLRQPVEPLDHAMDLTVAVAA
jgi:hypothetical protein